jgi:hypothetical protein|tara:strand:+ start:720 stop:1190 length:471 start_codon:yes stop_codon:yes gene_type:complete
MKAININGNIKEYRNVPKSWGNVIGGFHLLSDSDLQTYGFYDIVIPADYNDSIHNLGDLYFDDANNVFKRDLIDKTWTETLDELKQNKIANYKTEINLKLQETDWYIVRNAETGAEIPANITTQRADYRAESVTIENEVNALTTKQEVILYEHLID